MVNPYVRDTVARVGRDPARKLGWDDRLAGAMRLAAGEGVEPQGYALGAAAALAALHVPTEDAPAFLRQLWSAEEPDNGEAEAVLAAITHACLRLQTWSAAGFPSLTVTNFS